MLLALYRLGSNALSVVEIDVELKSNFFLKYNRFNYNKLIELTDSV